MPFRPKNLRVNAIEDVIMLGKEGEDRRNQELGDLLDKATPNEPVPASGRLRDISVYRGVSCAEHSLLSSLDRLGGIGSLHSKAHLEEHLLRNFLRYGSFCNPDAGRVRPDGLEAELEIGAPEVRAA